jgi:hypothetical protein
MDMPTGPSVGNRAKHIPNPCASGGKATLFKIYPVAGRRAFLGKGCAGHEHAARARMTERTSPRYSAEAPEI